MTTRPTPPLSGSAADNGINAFADKHHEYHVLKDTFETTLYTLCLFEYERFSCDDYDGSIEFHGVMDDVRLNDAACAYLSGQGFSKCYLNHQNKWETHYSALPTAKEWRVSYPHKNGGKGLLVEEIPESWKEPHNAIVVERKKP